MTRFTTRVELHDADSDDYNTLHDAMRAKGFSRLIADNDGKKYRLPTAEYNFDGDVTRGQVLDKAVAAAKQTGLEYEIIVTQSNGRTWHGLKPA